MFASWLAGIHEMLIYCKCERRLALRALLLNFSLSFTGVPGIIMPTVAVIAGLVMAAVLGAGLLALDAYTVHRYMN